MDIIPLETTNNIINYISNNIKIFLKYNIIQQLKELHNIILINKYYNYYYLKIFKDKKRILNLFNKYHYYRKEYQKYLFTPENYDRPPILYDALLTGLNIPFSHSSINVYNEEIHQDIIDIIRLIPGTVTYSYGQLRCRSKVSSLQVACINPNIDIDIIKLLLKNGANPKQKLLVNGWERTILQDLKENISENRYIEISKLLKLN